MAAPWEEYQQTPVPTGPWSEYQQAKPAKNYQPLSVLPFSVSDDGQDFKFDPHAGLLGKLLGAASLPGDVATGKVDPMSQEGIGRAADLATFASPVNPAVRAGDLAIPGAKMAQTVKQPVATPTAEALTEAGTKGYDAARKLGVEYSPKAINDLANQTILGLNNDGLIAENAPTAHAILAKLAEPQPEGATAPFVGVHAARKAFSKLAQQKGMDGRPTPDAAAASAILPKIDAFLESPPASGVVAGPAAQAGQLVQEANANYGAGLRSNKIQGIEDAAELRAAAANSGKNIGNTLRQRIASLVLNPRQSGGFSPEEVSALEDVVKGSPTRNAARYIGNLFGGGGGLGQAIATGLGAAAGAGAGHSVEGAGIGAVAPLVVGYTAKKMENALTQRAVNAVDELIRQRSPMYRGLLDAAPSQPVFPTAQNMAMRGLLYSGSGNNNR